MTKKLTFHEIFRYSRTVNGHKGLLAALTFPVNGPRHQLLAYAAFAGYQYRPICPGYLANLGIEVGHGIAVANHAMKALLRRSQAQCGQLLTQQAISQNPPDTEHQVLQVQWFGQEIIGSGFESLHGLADGPEPRDHNTGWWGVLPLERLKKLQPSHTRQTQVADHQIHCLSPHHAQPLLRGHFAEHLVACVGYFIQQQLREALVILHQQNTVLAGIKITHGRLPPALSAAPPEKVLRQGHSVPLQWSHRAPL